MTSRLHDCANDSGMSNLSHVDVKTTILCTVSVYHSGCYWTKQDDHWKPHSGAAYYVTFFKTEKKNRFLFWWKLIDYWSCIVAATKECSRRLVEPFSLFRNVSLAGICIHFEGEIIFRKASSRLLPLEICRLFSTVPFQHQLHCAVF